MKICSKCKIKKPLTSEFFSKKSSSKDGMRSYCKKCGAAYTLQWNKDNPEHRENYAKENRSYLLSIKKVYRENNKVFISEYQKKWIKANPNYHTKWSNDNRDKTRKAVNKYHATRRKSDIGFKISSNVSRSIRYSLSNAIEGKQGRRWEVLVGYTRHDLKDHIERQFVKGMDWNNWGDWHIDHITPIVSFDIQKAGDDEFMNCWSLSNLRPIWAIDNIKKSARINFLL